MVTVNRRRELEATRVDGTHIALVQSKRNPHANFTKVGDVVTHSLLHELDAAKEMWRVDTSRQRKIRCQRNTENIFLRAAKKPLPVGVKNANDVHESREMKMAARFPKVLRFCMSFAHSIDGQLGRVTLVGLRPHAAVYPHVDLGAYYRIRDRYHLVLASPDGSALTAGDETVVMREGELWAFNNKIRHSAKNLSDVRRVHLIFDVLPKTDQGHFVFSPLETDTTVLAS